MLGVDPTPFDDEFEYELLRPPALGVASYVSFTECAFLHKDSKTLLVTDAVVGRPPAPTAHQATRWTCAPVAGDQCCIPHTWTVQLLD